MKLKVFRAALLASSAAAHGGMTLPLPRNSFGAPLNKTGKQALPAFFSNYYDDGCLVGCDSCRHHGAQILNTSSMNPWGPPQNVGCTVNPIPACACDAGINCRYNGSSARGASYVWLPDWNEPYDSSTDGPPGCSHGTMFEPPWPQGYGHIAERVDEGGGRSPTFDYELVDRVKVPTEKGEYVVSWRWDTEQKSQVWSACGDIVIE